MDKSAQNQPLAGMLWMLLAGLAFVGVTATIKAFGTTVPAAEAAFLRYIMGIPFLLPMLWPIFRAKIDRRALALFSLRGLAHSGGVICWFFAMTKIPLSEVTAMNYLSPVYLAIGAALLLGEPLARRRITAIVVALFGALIILRPGFREVGIGHLSMLAATFFMACGYLLAKFLSSTFSATVVVGMLSLMVTVGLAPFAWWVWQTPTLVDLGWFFVTACFATLGHLAMTKAFAAAPLAVTQPVTFLQLIWAVVLGAAVFGEPVDFWVVFGGGLIMAAISYITWREALATRRRKSAQEKV